MSWYLKKIISRPRHFPPTMIRSIKVENREAERLTVAKLAFKSMSYHMTRRQLKSVIHIVLSISNQIFFLHELYSKQRTSCPTHVTHALKCTIKGRTSEAKHLQIIKNAIKSMRSKTGRYDLETAIHIGLHISHYLILRR